MSRAHEYARAFLWWVAGVTLMFCVIAWLGARTADAANTAKTVPAKIDLGFSAKYQRAFNATGGHDNTIRKIACVSALRTSSSPAYEDCVLVANAHTTQKPNATWCGEVLIDQSLAFSEPPEAVMTGRLYTCKQTRSAIAEIRAKAHVPGALPA